jgi:hypothetical protein
VTTASFWAQFWPQFWSAIVAGIALGVVFTIGWGLVSGRRDTIARRIDQLGAWSDQAAESGGLWLEHLDVYLRGRDDLEEWPQGKEALFAEIRSRRVAFRAARLRMSAIQGVHGLFDDHTVQRGVEEIVREARAIDDELMAIDLETATPEQLRDPQARLDTWMRETLGLVAYLESQMTFRAICGYYRGGIEVSVLLLLLSLAVYWLRSRCGCLI